MIPFRFAAVSCALALVLLYPCTPVSAATVTPTRFDDPVPNGCVPHDCSLREAVIAANAYPGKDTIVLRAGEYRLTLSGNTDSPQVADLDITETVRIVGNGSGTTSILNLAAGGPARETRIFEAIGANLELGGVTLRGGRIGSHAVNPEGGCILARPSSGASRLDDVGIADCKAPSGGGIAGWNFRLIDVRIRNCEATTGSGGGMQVSTRLDLTRVRITDNRAATVGGGVYVYGVMANIPLSGAGDSVIARNGAQDGGGIGTTGLVVLRVYGSSADPLRIEDNEAVRGGGIWSSAVKLEVGHARVHRNHAQTGGGIGSSAGLQVSDTELRDNIASASGGGLYAGLYAELRRLGAGGNVAAQGGALYLDGLGPKLVENVSLYSNEAAQGGAVYLHGVSDSATLVNVSMHDNLATAGDGSDGLVLDGGTSELAANWLGDGCRVLAGSSTTLGGNAQRSGTLACGLGAADAGAIAANAVALSVGPFGGAFDVVGFAAGTSALENASGSAACADDDVRGFTRVDGLCDIGAFEATATPP